MINFQASGKPVSAFIPEYFTLPGAKLRDMVYTIAGGQTLPLGTVMGVVTATGKLLKSVKTATDGSQVPAGIMLMPLATFAADGVTALDMSVSVYVAGKFNLNALTFDASWTAATIKDPLRIAGLLTDVPGFSG
jgi:hypothetical protein